MAAAIFWCCGAAGAHAGWVIEPVFTAGDAGWNIDLDVDSSSQLHAGFFSGIGSYQYVARQGGSWTPQQTFDNGYDFEPDKSGRPSVLVRAAPTYDLALSTRQDNGTWTNQTIALAQVSTVMSLAYDSLNRAHVAYVDPAAKELRYASFNGTSWNTATVATGNEFQYGNSGFDFKLDSADQAHFAWSAFGGALTYARPVGSSWQIAPVPDAPNAYPWDLQIDSAGRAHLAYDLSTGSAVTGGLHYGLFDGTSWETQRISGLDYFGAGQTKLAIDALNNPHLFTLDRAFDGPDLLRHVYWANSVWTNEPITEWDNTVFGPEAISVELAADGYHVLYSTDAMNVFHAFLAVPEPSTFVTAASGMAMALLSGRRLRKQRVHKRAC